MPAGAGGSSQAVFLENYHRGSAPKQPACRMGNNFVAECYFLYYSFNMRSFNMGFLCRKITSLLILFLVFGVQTLWAQETDPASYIGITLSGLIEQLGVPLTVHASRGLNEWQDDVVFVYNEGDFFIFRDRVWQLGIRSAYRIRAGDARDVVFLSFGEAVYSGSDFATFPLNGYSWPMAIRFNFDSNGRVAMIFIFRSDL